MEIGTVTMEILLIAFISSVIVNIGLIFYLRKVQKKKEVIVVKSPDVDKVFAKLEAETSKEINPFQPKVVTPETVPATTPELAQDITAQPEEIPPPRPEESMGIPSSAIPIIPLYPMNVNNPEACEYCGKTGLKRKTIHQYRCKKRLGIA